MNEQTDTLRAAMVALLFGGAIGAMGGVVFLALCALAWVGFELAGLASYLAARYAPPKTGDDTLDDLARLIARRLHNWKRA